MHQAQSPTSQAGAACKAIRSVLGGCARLCSSPRSNQAPCKQPLGFQKGQERFGHLAEAVVSSFEIISKEPELLPLGKHQVLQGALACEA